MVLTVPRIHHHWEPFNTTWATMLTYPFLSEFQKAIWILSLIGASCTSHASIYQVCSKNASLSTKSCTRTDHSWCTILFPIGREISGLSKFKTCFHYSMQCLWGLEWWVASWIFERFELRRLSSIGKLIVASCLPVTCTIKQEIVLVFMCPIIAHSLTMGPSNRITVCHPLRR